MTREYWYALFHDVRTGIPGLPNLFPPDERASIALQMAQAERKDKWREENTKKFAH